MNARSFTYGAQYYRAGCIVNGNGALENMQVVEQEECRQISKLDSL